VRTPERYIDVVTRGESTEAASETLDEEQIVAERVQLTLRRREGVLLSDLPGDPTTVIEELTADGLVEVKGDALVLTEAGRLLANAVTLRLI
jgi:oxygen-independent coproporphyrinogen-3 oxidase